MEFSKFVITIPHKKGTSEYENCRGMFGDIQRDNPDYTIYECLECEECGAVNDTVRKVTPTGMALCDYCYYRIGEVVDNEK